MMLMLERESDVPIYQQIFRQIRDQIVSGRLPAGSEASAGITRTRRHTIATGTRSMGASCRQLSGAPRVRHPARGGCRSASF